MAEHVADGSAVTLMSLPPPRPGLVPAFHDIGDDQFEDLCRELLQAELDVETVERYGTRGQRQLGIDLLVYYKDNRLAVGQCKSHEVCDEALIRAACDEFLKHAEHWRGEGVDTFILLLAADTRRHQLHDERQSQRARLKTAGFAFKVWSGAVLTTKLSRQRTLVRRFFTYLEEYICGPSAEVNVRLRMQGDTIQALSGQLTEVAEGEHDEVRRLWRDGRTSEARRWLGARRADSLSWNVLPPATRAKWIRLEGRIVLSTGDLATAKQLAAEADAVEPGPGGRLAALIAQAEGRLEDAARLLDGDSDPDSQALKAAIQIQAGRFERAWETLSPLVDHADAHRLRSLILLARNEPAQARAEAEKALALAPSWYWMRWTAAAMRYLTGVAGSALPRSLPEWPEPVHPNLIRVDDESVVARRLAADEFGRLSAPEFDQGPTALACLRSWRIASLADNPDTVDEAAALARASLESDPSDYRTLAWVLGRELRVDTAPSIAELERRLGRGGASLEEVIALIAALAHAERLDSASDILQSQRGRFTTESAERLWQFWETQISTLSAAASSALASPTERMASALRRLRAADASGGRDTAWQQYLLLAQMGQWGQIAPKAKELVSSMQTPAAARLASYTLYNVRDYAGCLEVLNAAPGLFFKGELTADLRQLRVLAQRATGALPEAIRTARESFETSPGRETLLQLARLCFQVGDLKAIASLARQHEGVAGLEALDYLQLAQFLRLEDVELALSLWKRAVAHGIEDEHVGLAFQIASNLGVGPDTKPLVHRMAALAASGQGGIQAFALADLPAWFASRRGHAEEVQKKLTAGEVPQHLALRVLGLNMAKVFHRLAAVNAHQLDGRSAGPVYVQYGGRPAGALPTDSAIRWRLNADLTAILTASQFGLLPKLEAEFGTIRIPQNTILALSQMRDDLAVGQPDRLAAKQHVLTAVANRRVERVDLSGPVVRDVDDGDVADDVLVLLRHANSQSRFVLDFLPVRSVDPMAPAQRVPRRYAALMRDAHSLVDALAQHGVLSSAERSAAEERLGERHGLPVNEHLPLGSGITCRVALLEQLALAGVLDVAAHAFRLEAPVHELEQEHHEVDAALVSEADAAWVGQLIARLRDGISDRRYLLLPALPALPRDNDENREPTPEDTVLFDLFRFQGTDEDLVWVDDRYVNAFEHRDGVRIVGTIDLLQLLRERGTLSVNEHVAVLTELRAADFRFVPFDEIELTGALLEAPVEAGQLVETKALRVLRQYYSRCILEATGLRPPITAEGTPNPSNEWGFLLRCGQAVVGALLAVFERDTKHAAVRAGWLMRNLYVDDRGIHGTTSQGTEADDAYRAAIGLAGVVAGTISLDGRQGGRRSRRAMLRWLEHVVIRGRFAADADFASAVIDSLKSVLIHSTERDSGEVAVAMKSLVARLWTDLPKVIRDRIDADQGFLQSIGVTVKPVAEIGPLRIERQHLWSAIAEVLSSGSPQVVLSTEGAKVTFERVGDSTTRARVTCEDPNFDGEVGGDEFGFLSETFSEREETARRLRHWFDLPKERRDDLVARIVGAQDAATRMELATEARDGSAEALYRCLYESIKEGATFIPSDAMPRDPQSLLDHLRISEGDPQAERWSRAAGRLVEERGAPEAALRLGGLPVPLAEHLAGSLASLPGARRRRALRAVRKMLLASPVGIVHLADLWARLPGTQRHRSALLRPIIRLLCDKGDAGAFAAWLAAIRWVDEQFGFDQRVRNLPTEKRLCLVWSHGDRLFRVLRARGLPCEWIREAFARKEYPLAHELVFPDSTYDGDVACPRHLSPEAFAIAGLTRIAGDARDRDLVRDELSAAISQADEGRQVSLCLETYADRTGATDALGSWLNPGATWSALLPPELSLVLSGDAVVTMRDAAIAGICNGVDERANWLKLRAVLGNHPMRQQVKEAVERAFLSVRLGAYLEKDPSSALAVLATASQHASDLPDAVRSHLQSEVLGAAARFDSLALDGELKETLGEVILDAIVSLNWWNSTVGSRTMAVADALQQLLDANSGLFARAGFLVLRLCEALPIRESRHLWRTRDLMRRTARL